LDDFYLDDRRWSVIATCLPGKAGDPGRHGRDNRLFIEAVLWIARTRSPWRGLPPHFGKWYTAYTRYRRWSEKQVWPEIFERLAADAGGEYFFEAGVIVHAPLRSVVATTGAGTDAVERAA